MYIISRNYRIIKSVEKIIKMNKKLIFLFYSRINKEKQEVICLIRPWPGKKEKHQPVRDGLIT